MALEIRFETVVSELFEENCYIVWRPGGAECLIIDPGLEPDAIIEVVTSNGLSPVAILNTHGHADHIAGNAAMKRRWPQAPLVIGRGDAEKLTDPAKNLSLQFGAPIVSPPADELVEEGGIYRAAGFELFVREIPGHSIGHVVFISQDDSPIHVFGGDVLFNGSVGRTDFPDGSFAQLASGIREKLFTLADDAVVLSGHGPPTTIGREKRTNPFVGVNARK